MSDKPRNPVGRPFEYNIEIAKEICDTIATNSKGVKRLCDERSHWPCADTVFRWRKIYPEFAEMFSDAKRHQIECLVDEILDIADDSSNDTLVKVDDKGNLKEVCNSEWLNRSRIRIDTRKWLACKLAPKIYGDKVQHDANINMAKQEDALKELE